MNPLMQSMAPAMGINSQAIHQIKQMAGMLRAAKNPQAAMMQAAQKNPQLGAVMQMCNGKSPQAVFDEQCMQHGLDPSQTMQQIQAMLGI